MFYRVLNNACFDVIVAQTYLLIDIIVDPVAKDKIFKILADHFNKIIKHREKQKDLL